MENGELNSSLLSPLLTTSEVIYASEVIRKITTAFGLSMEARSRGYKQVLNRI